MGSYEKENQFEPKLVCNKGNMLLQSYKKDSKKIYNCKHCDYTTCDLSNWKKHLITKKHVSKCFQNVSKCFQNGNKKRSKR